MRSIDNVCAWPSCGFLCLCLVALAPAAGPAACADPAAPPPADPEESAPRDPDFLKPGQAEPLAPRPSISGVEHVVIHYDTNTYCGHPREVLFKHFGGGEIVLGHYHAPSRYEVYEDVRHICYQGRSALYLQRSLDGGRTWPPEHDAVLFRQTMSPDEKRAFLFPAEGDREAFDMFRPESVFLFARTHLSPEHAEVPVCFSLRSPNKGRTWERVPTIVRNPSGADLGLHRHNTPVIAMLDGKTLLAAFQMVKSIKSPKWERGPAVFASADQGVTWQLLSRPAVDRSHEGVFTYVSLLLLPDGTLHCYLLHLTEDLRVEGLRNAIAMCVSRDEGRTWTDPVAIVGKGAGCWKDPGKEGSVYRSPWPVLLRDGRILVLFARRRMPAGIGGIVSADGGKTWSEEFAIRDDGKWWDLGYPVGCQLEDGRIFTAYYYNTQDGNRQGGTRHIVGSFFKID